jgi:hypothetical protein
VETFERLVERLHRAGVRFVVIGLSGANYYARSGAALFATQDRDLFLPSDPDALLDAWRACEAVGLELYCAGEPLDRPRDRLLAERVVAHQALVRATDGVGLDVDFTLVMEGLAFDRVWKRRRSFRVGRVQIPVARLADIVESKRQAGRDKDRLFLATHADALRDLMKRDRRPTRRHAPSRRKRRPR